MAYKVAIDNGHGYNTAGKRQNYSRTIQRNY